MKTILVIRQADEFSRILTRNAFEVVNLPLIETKPLADLSDFETKLRNIEKYDGIFLTSRNAAQILAAKFDELQVKFDGKIYVLGGKSFEILKDRNLDLIFCEDANNASEMLAGIEVGELRDKTFLFVRGEKSLEIVPNFLRGFAAVDEAMVYANEPIILDVNRIAAISEAIKNAELAAICFFSPSGAESFFKQFGAAVLHQTKIAAIGKTTAEYFEARDLTVDFVSSKSNAESFAVELIKFLREEI